ncbi:MAG: aspartate aminotransferase family protein [Campylobacterota bacterium]
MKMLEQLDKEYVLQTYARNYVNFKKGINSTLYDENDKDYIDFTSGIGVVCVGHGNKQLADAISTQASKLIHTSNLYAIQPQAKLAKKIAQHANMDIKSFFCNSGAEANEAAIKLARKYGKINFENKKYKIITLEHSFHGRTITTVKATGQGSMHSPNFEPYPDGFSYHNQIDDIYNSIDDETVAVMIELVQGEGGVQPFEKSDIQELATFLKKHDILLIIDEVQTGVYRTGEFLASNLYEIEPDIITLAKGLGGGVPIGAVLTKHKNLFEVGDHGSTFGGNFLSCSAALKVLDILEDYKEKGFLDETIIYFQKMINELFENHKDIFTHTVGLGLMRGLRVKDSDTLTAIIKEAFDNQVLVLKAGRNTLRMLPILTVSKDEINKGFKRLDNALSKIK